MINTEGGGKRCNLIGQEGMHENNLTAAAYGSSFSSQEMLFLKLLLCDQSIS